MLPLPPRSTLFPYTTLFRSTNTVETSEGLGDLRTDRGELDHRHRKQKREGYVHQKIAERHRVGLYGVAADNNHDDGDRSEEHTSELQSQFHLVCRLLLEKKK